MRLRILTAPAVWLPIASRTTVLDVRAEHDVTFVAVVDSNVLLDFYSCHDLANVYDALGAAGIETPMACYRRARVRQAVMLAMYLNASKASTYSLHAEVLRLLLKNAPPKDTRKSFEAAFTTEQIYLVKDRLLPDWDLGMPTVPESAQGTAADDLLIGKAKALGVPLITNEGFTPDGIVEDKMRKRAKVAGVVALTPQEFYAGRIGNERALIDDFLARFEVSAAERIENRPELTHLFELLRTMHGYYKHVLLGITEGRDSPVSVTIGPPSRRTSRVTPSAPAT